MVAFVDNTGAQNQVELDLPSIMAEAKQRNITPVAVINRQFAAADLSIGPAFKQFQASAGLVAADNPFGLAPVAMAALLDGNGFQAGNTQQNTTPFGTSSRAFTAISIIDAIENALAKDRVTDLANFYAMVGSTINVSTEHFEQPVVSYDNLDGAQQAKAVRVAQGALPPRMAFFKTADRIRRIGSWTIGMEWTDQALKATTLDFVTMTMARYLAVERDERAYRYISDLFVGNGDLVVGAVPAVTSTSLDAAATGGVLTHKAWVKWLARNFKYRKITHVVCDIDTYLKVEGRTGRPGTVNYDPTLSRIDPQAVALNQVFGGDVTFVIVESAADGGPVPANTLYGVDARTAITLVRNSSAAYNAIEAFALKRTTALRMDWSEEIMRTFGDTDLKAFDALTIA